MLFSTSAVALVGSYLAGSVSGITASDLPDCAVNCYFLAMEETDILPYDFEGQCRSPPFQISMSSCAGLKCVRDEFNFVSYYRLTSNLR